MAKKKYSPNDISSKNDDWGMDANDTDKRPFSGGSVQKFIKKTFDEKIGVLHYDTNSNRYVAFADVASRDIYLDDPTRTDLVLGAFDAPFNFTATLSLISSQSNVLLKGSTGHYIEYTFDITNKSGASTMESVNVTYTFISGNSRKRVLAQYAYGTKVSMCIDDYLGEGETVVQIAIVGQDTLAATTRSVSYRVLDLALRSGYNVGGVNNVSDNPYIQVPFYVKSSRHVILKASVDYGDFDTVLETDTYETNGACQIDAQNLSEGKHNVRLMAQNIIDGVVYSSDVVYKDFIIDRGSIGENLVLFDGIIPFGSDDTEYRLYGLKKYIPGSVTLAAYNATNAQSDVIITLESGGSEHVIGQKILANGTSETVSFTPLVSGAATLKVKNGDVIAEVKANIETSSVQIEEITNLLELSLRSIGRSNSDTDKEKWESGTYKTTFSGFVWNSRSGWVNNALKINTGAAIDVDIAPLSFNPENTGFTFEFEFSTELVSDENAVIMDLTEDGRGIKVTASSISLVSGNGREVSTRFRAGEKHRVAFVIDNTPVRNSKLSYLYIDGVPSGSVDFINSDSYSVSKQIHIGGTQGAVVNVSDIRIYRRALSAQEIRNNYTLYQSTSQEMLSIYNRNDIMTGGKIDYEKVANFLPVMIVTGDIALLENTTNKKERIIVNVRYINRQHPERKFNIINAVMTPQGTSSMFYPKHNFRLYTMKDDNTELRIGSSELGEGTLVENKLYSFKEGAQAVNTWCFKADYAESSSTHNTGVARIWNDALANMQVSVDGSLKYVGRTQAQQAAINGNYEYDVRTAVDGFPIVMFYHNTEEDPLIFMGKYNFNNDKSTESVFGFRGIPGFDNTKVECWEQLDSGNPYGLFIGDPEGFDTNWDKAFEGRYPDGNTNTDALKKLYVWLNSCKDNQEKFNAEWKEHFDPYKVAAYYIYLMRFGGVDQTVKNAMLMTEDGDRWFFINYDNDTIFGLDNDGLLSFGWDITRQSKIGNTDVYCYAGHDSLLWNLLEGCEDFMKLVPEVDQALYSARKGKQDAGISYANVIKMFNEEQSGKWCETIYAEDAKYKYIDPYKNNSINQLEKLQGRRSSHRAWWVQNRWNLFDGKWMTGEFRKDGITFKCQQGAAGTKLTVTAGNEMFYGIKVQTTMIQSESLGVGVSHDFAIDRPLQIGTPVSVCNPSNIAGLDISNFADYISSLDVQKVKNSLGESRLKKLIIGKSGVANNFLSNISGIENAYALQELNISGFKQITSLDLSQQTDLRILSASQSGLRDVSLPEGAPVVRLELPDTMQVLKLIGMTELSVNGLVFDNNWKGVTSITVVGCPKFSNNINVVTNWIKVKPVADADCSLYMDNIDWKNVAPEDFIKICNAKQNGMNVILKGVVKLSTSSQEVVDVITRAFGVKVFQEGNELYVNAPDAIYLSGPDIVLEGDSAQFTAAVFSEHMGTVSYSITNGSRPGVNINGYTGLLTSVENGYADSKLTISAIHRPSQGASVLTNKTITIKQRIYPRNVTINGNAKLNVELNKFSWSCSDSGVTGEVRTEWSLSGDITEYSEMYSQEGNTCVVKKTRDSIETVEGVLTAKLYSVNTGALKKTVTKSITILNPDIIMTKISNPEVMAIMYDKGLCANESYMTKAEAALVEDTQLNPTASSQGSIFFSTRRRIRRFDEFEYFTGLLSIPAYCFEGCGLTSIKLPPNILSICKGAFTGFDKTGNYIEELNIPEGVVNIGSGIFSERFRFSAPDGFQMHLTLPSTLKVIENEAFYGVPIAIVSGFPDGLTSIGDKAFTGYNATELSLPNSLTKLGMYAFSGTDLTEFVVPEGVTTVEMGCIAGKNCTMYVHSKVTNFTCQQFMIKEIVVDPGNPKYRNYKGIVVDTNNRAVNVPAYLDAVEFNMEGITYFSGGYINNHYEYSCEYLMNVKKLILSKDITTRGFSNNFIGMPLLEEIDLAGNTNFTLKDGHLFSADGTTLYKLVKAEHYTVPDGVRYIHRQHYGNVNDLVIPDNNEDLSSKFKYYQGAKITIKGKHHLFEAFYFSNGLKIVDLSEASSYEYRYFFGNSSVEEVLIGSTFRFEDDNMFSGTKLKTLTIPEGCDMRSAEKSFDKLETLEYIDIPSTTQTMPYFRGCINLKTIICRQTIAPTLSSLHFGDSTKLYTGINTKDTGENTLYVPSGSTGYDQGRYASVLLNPDLCGFTL